MRLGICSLWGESLDMFRGQVKLASRLGYDLITVGDSPAGWREMVCSLTIAAMDAPGAQIASLITSPFMRHPVIVANAFSTLHELTDGRAVLGFATGGSTVMAVGRMPATSQQVASEIAAYRALFAGDATEWEGRPVKALRFARAVPIYYSAFGPKALKLAGEMADGVILFAGDRDMDGLAKRIAAVRDAATRSGRDADAIDIWVTSYLSVRSERQAALDDLKAFIAVNALMIRSPEAMAMLAPHIRPLVEEFQRRYDVNEHVVVGGQNVQLMDRLGLTEAVQEIDTIAGSVDHVAQILGQMEAMGVSTVIAALPGHAAPEVTIRGLAEARARVEFVGDASV